MIERRSVLGAFLAAPFLSGRADADAEVPREFRVGYQKGGILALARQQGTIERALKTRGVASVKWVEFQYGPPLLEALGVGSIDLGAVGDTPPIFAQAAGAKVVYAAAAPSSQSAILVPKDSPLASTADLRGKRLAFARGSSSHNFVVQALAKAGLAPGDVQQTFLSPADAVAAFTRRSIDAWAVWDPYFALAEQKHDARAIVTTQGVLEPYSFYLANRDFATRHPAILRASLDALGETYRWGEANRDKLATAISEVTGIEAAVQNRAVQRMKIEIGPLTEPIIRSQQRIADSFHQLGIVPRQVNVRDIVWTAPQS